MNTLSTEETPLSEREREREIETQQRLLLQLNLFHRFGKDRVDPFLALMDVHAT
jgi:hypothetical protein